MKCILVKTVWLYFRQKPETAPSLIGRSPLMLSLVSCGQVTRSRDTFLDLISLMEQHKSDQATLLSLLR